MRSIPARIRSTVSQSHSIRTPGPKPLRFLPPRDASNSQTSTTAHAGIVKHPASLRQHSRIGMSAHFRVSRPAADRFAVCQSPPATSRADPAYPARRMPSLAYSRPPYLSGSATARSPRRQHLPLSPASPRAALSVSSRASTRSISPFDRDLDAQRRILGVDYVPSSPDSPFSPMRHTSPLSEASHLQDELDAEREFTRAARYVRLP